MRLTCVFVKSTEDARAKYPVVKAAGKDQLAAVAISSVATEHRGLRIAGDVARGAFVFRVT